MKPADITKRIKDASYETLEFYKYGAIFLVVADIFLVYWYLEAKRAGILIMMFLLVALTFILFLQRSKSHPERPDNPPDNTSPPKVIRRPPKRPGPAEEVVIYEEEPAPRVIYKKKSVRRKKNPRVQYVEEEYEDPSSFDNDFGLPSAQEYNKRLEDEFKF